MFRWPLKVPVYLARWRIHLWYLDMQAKFPDLFPRGEYPNDVPGCEGSATFQATNTTGRYRTLCTCHKGEWAAALKAADTRPLGRSQAIQRSRARR